MASTTTRDDPPFRPLPALGWMAGAMLSFCAMAIAGRELATFHDTFEIMAFRSVVGLVVVVFVAGVAGTLGEIRTDRIGLHAARNVLHFTGQNLWFLAITLAPLAQVFAVEFTSPIWVALAAPFVLGERLTPRRLLGALGGFLGILIVLRPGLAGFELGAMLGVLAAVCFAATNLATKGLTRDQSLTCILFWLTALQTCMGLAMVFADGVVGLPTPDSLPWLILVAFCGLSAHYCLTSALKLAPAAVVTPMEFARLPAIAVVGAVFYAEPLDPAVFVGAAVIAVAIFGIVTEKPVTRPMS